LQKEFPDPISHLIELVVQMNAEERSKKITIDIECGT